MLEHNPANQTPCHPDGEPSEEEVGLVVAALDAACQAYAEEIKTAQEPIKVDAVKGAPGWTVLWDTAKIPAPLDEPRTKLTSKSPSMPEHTRQK